MILTKFHIGKILGSKTVKDGAVFTYDPKNSLLTAFKDVFVDFKTTKTHTILHLDENVDVYISKKSKLLIKNGEFVSERKGIAILPPGEPVYVHSKNTGPIMKMTSPFHVPVSANPNTWKNFDFFFKFVNVFDKKVKPAYDVEANEDKESLSVNANGIFRKYLFKQDDGFDINAEFWDDGLKRKEKRFVDNLKKKENGLRSGHMFQFIVQCGNDEDAFRFKFLNLEPYIEQYVKLGFRRYVRANDEDENLVPNGDQLFIRDLNKYYPYLSRWRFGEVRYDKLFTQVDPGNEEEEHHREVLENCRIVYWFHRYLGILKEFIISASLNHLTAFHNGKRVTNAFIKTDYVGHYQEEVDLKLYNYLTQRTVPRDEIGRIIPEQSNIVPEYASHRQDLINNAVKLLQIRNPKSYYFNYKDVPQKGASTYHFNFGFVTNSMPSIEVEEGENVKKSLKHSFQKLTEAANSLTRETDTQDVMYFSATLRDYHEVSLGEYFRELLKQYADERLSIAIGGSEAKKLARSDFTRKAARLQKYKNTGDNLRAWQGELLAEPITLYNTKITQLNNDLSVQNYGSGDSNAIDEYWDMVKELLLKGDSENNINEQNIFVSLSSVIQDKLKGYVGDMLYNFEINLIFLPEELPLGVMDMYTNTLQYLNVDMDEDEGTIDKKILRRFIYDRVRDVHSNLGSITSTTKFNTVEGMKFVRDRYKEAMISLIRFFPDFVTLFRTSYLDYARQRMKVCLFQIVWALRAADPIKFRHNDLHVYNVRMKHIDFFNRKDLLFFNFAGERKVPPAREQLDESDEGEYREGFDESSKGEYREGFDESSQGEDREGFDEFSQDFKLGNPQQRGGERGITPPQTIENIFQEIQGENHIVEARGKKPVIPGWRLDFKIPRNFYTHSIVIIDFDRSEMNYRAFFDKYSTDRRASTRGFSLTKKREYVNRMNALMKASMYYWENFWVKSEEQNENPEEEGFLYKQYETKKELNTVKMDPMVDIKKLIQDLDLIAEEVIEQTRVSDLRSVLDDKFFTDIYKKQYSPYRPDPDVEDPLPWIFDHPYFEEFKNYINEFTSENINTEEEDAFWNYYLQADVPNVDDDPDKVYIESENECVWKGFILGYGRQENHHLLETCTFDREPNDFGATLNESIETSLEGKAMQGLTKRRKEKEYQDLKDIYFGEETQVLLDESGQGERREVFDDSYQGERREGFDELSTPLTLLDIQMDQIIQSYGTGDTGDGQEEGEEEIDFLNIGALSTENIDESDRGEDRGVFDVSSQGEQRAQYFENLTQNFDEVDDQGFVSTNQPQTQQQIIFEESRDDVDLQVRQLSQNMIMPSPSTPFAEERTSTLYGGQFDPGTPGGLFDESSGGEEQVQYYGTGRGGLENIFGNNYIQELNELEV